MKTFPPHLKVALILESCPLNRSRCGSQPTIMSSAMVYKNISPHWKATLKQLWGLVYMVFEAVEATFNFFEAALRPHSPLRLHGVLIQWYTDVFLYHCR